MMLMQHHVVMFFSGRDPHLSAICIQKHIIDCVIKKRRRTCATFFRMVKVKEYNIKEYTLEMYSVNTLLQLFLSKYRELLGAEGSVC
jgi:hypothetical protein